MDRLYDPSLISSVIVMTMALAAIRFFWPLVRNLPDSFERHMVLSVVWMGGTMFARTAYWDMLQGLLNRADWVEVRDFLRGQDFSILFNIGFIVAMYYALQGARYLLPEDERDAWPWWKVWTYPTGPCIAFWKERRK